MKVDTDNLLSREERIKKYAYEYYLRYKKEGFPEDHLIKAEHIVNAEDRVMMMDMEYKFKHRPSRMK